MYNLLYHRFTARSGFEVWVRSDSYRGLRWRNWQRRLYVMCLLNLSGPFCFNNSEHNNSRFRHVGSTVIQQPQKLFSFTKWKNMSSETGKFEAEEERPMSRNSIKSSQQSFGSSSISWNSPATQGVASIASYCLANMAMTITNKYVFSVISFSFKYLC